MSPRPLAVLCVAIAACRGPAEPPAKTEPTPPRGPIQRAKQGVEKAQKASEQRTDDAFDRATKAEGSSSRSTPAK